MIKERASALVQPLLLATKVVDSETMNAMVYGSKAGVFRSSTK